MGDHDRRVSSESSFSGDVASWRPTGALMVALVISYACVLSAFVVGYVVAQARGLPVSHIALDPASSQGFHPLVGFLSHLAVLGWATAAIISLFTAGLVSRGQQRIRGLLLAAGGLSLILMLDDLFMIHENVPGVLGVPEFVVYLVYASAMAWILVRFRREWTAYYPWLLMLAGAGFAGSLGMDQLYEFNLLVEEFFKTSGIVTWAIYWTGLARRALILSR